MTTKPLILSHSFLSTFEKCPKQAWHRYIARDVPYVETEAIKYGNDVHKAFELRINENSPMPEYLSSYESLVEALGPSCFAELELGVTEEGKPTSFTATNCFMRGKVDVLKIDENKGFILDWKTGRKWEDPSELQRHAILIHAHFPQLEELSGAYMWLKEMRLGKVYNLLKSTDLTFSKAKATKLRVDDLLDGGEEWAATPNKLCPWCPVETCRSNPAYIKEKE